MRSPCLCILMIVIVASVSTASVSATAESTAPGYGSNTAAAPQAGTISGSGNLILTGPGQNDLRGVLDDCVRMDLHALHAPLSFIRITWDTQVSVNDSNSQTLPEPVLSGSVVYDALSPKGDGEYRIENSLSERNVIAVLYRPEAWNCTEFTDVCDVNAVAGFDLSKPLMAVYVGAAQTVTVGGLPNGSYVGYMILAEDWDSVQHRPGEDADVRYLAAVYDEHQRKNPDSVPNIFQFIQFVVPEYVEDHSGGAGSGDEMGDSNYSGADDRISSTHTPPTLLPDGSAGSIAPEETGMDVSTPDSSTPNPLKSPLGIIVGAIAHVKNIAGDYLKFLLVAAAIVVVTIIAAIQKGRIGRK